MLHVDKPVVPLWGFHSQRALLALLSQVVVLHGLPVMLFGRRMSDVDFHSQDCKSRAISALVTRQRRRPCRSELPLQKQNDRLGEVRQNRHEQAKVEASKALHGLYMLNLPC